MITATIENIKQLRAELAAPYQDCVQALNENENNIELAKQWLKDKGKGITRDSVTEHGTIGFYADDTGATVVIVKCETDFVAVNEEFVAMVENLVANQHKGSVDAIEQFTQTAWVFGETISIGDTDFVPIIDNEQVEVYMHHNRTRAAVLKYIGDDVAAARKIAMQICAMKPTCVRTSDVDADEYERLISKAKEEAREAGKPEAILDKIADGKVKSALKEFVLLEQPMFDDAKSTVGEFADKNGINVISFLSVSL